MEKVTVYIEIVRKGIKIPEYSNIFDAGMDVRAAKDVLILPKETIIVPTGFKVAIPKGYEIQVRPRSGLSYNTPLRLSNSPGTIDSGYRDEVGIILTNTSDIKDQDNHYSITTKKNKSGTYEIKKGERIAQFVLGKVPQIKFEIVDDVKKIGQNRGGGFGSTGV